ncbi:MAG: hypothetical protein KGY80_10175 [Candidatus Thorarchaeota archaeon]|nr:hypothetical protein [Candidatus Thorarchaeota archaeon]
MRTSIFISLSVVLVFSTLFFSPTGIIDTGQDWNDVNEISELKSNFNTRSFDEAEMPSVFSKNRLPVSLLVYTEFADLTPSSHNEFRNTIESLQSTYGPIFRYENLTDYTELTNRIDEHDILLIVEQENAYPSNITTIASAWGPILEDFVASGGILIVMDYVGSFMSTRGITAGILNQTGLLQVYNPSSFGSGTLSLENSSDPLPRGIYDSTFPAVSGTVAFDVFDGIPSVNSSSQAVVTHKTIGSGHIALLGFDLYTRSIYFDTILANAIRLHRHVVFDNSHSQVHSIFSGFINYTEELTSIGFAVSSMETFDTDWIEGCDILVLTYCLDDYSESEVEIIKNFVEGGGALFVTAEYGLYGDAIDTVIERFGFVREKTYNLENGTNGIGVGGGFYLNNTNHIRNHSVSVDVARIENHGATALTKTPDDATTIAVADEEMTWTNGTSAEGMVITAGITVSTGRVLVHCDSSLLLGDTDTDNDGTENFYDSNNEDFLLNSIRWLSGAGQKERIVLFDESHHANYWVNASYKGFANFLTENGHTVQWMTQFNEEMIDSAHVIVIQDGLRNYTVSEIDYLENFADSGGGLFICGGWGQFGLEADKVGNAFGIDRNNTGYLQDSDDSPSGGVIVYDEANLGNHRIMEGMKRMELVYSSAFNSIGGAVSLLDTDDDGTCTWSDGGLANDLSVIAASTSGLGRIVYAAGYRFLKYNSDNDGDGENNLYDSDNELFVSNAFGWLAENRAPEITVISPNGGETLSDNSAITWSAQDPNKDQLLFDVYYSDDSGSSWNSIGTGLSGTSVSWDTTSVEDGDEFEVRVIAKDYELDSIDESDAVFTVDNMGPTILEFEHSPSSPVPTDSIWIKANVTDISGISSVICNYTVDSGTSWTAVTMEPRSGDEFNVSIGTFENDTTIEYRIRSNDTLGHWSDWTSLENATVFIAASTTTTTTTATESTTTTETTTTPTDTGPFGLPETIFGVDTLIVLAAVGALVVILIVVLIKKR